MGTTNKAVTIRSLLVSLTLVCACNTFSAGQEQSVPYKELSSPPESYTAGKVLSRMVDGLGFRFYWATDGLRQQDLDFRPSQGARSSRETIEHIYEMSFIILNATTGATNESPNIDLSFKEIREVALRNLKAASDRLGQSSEEELKKYLARFKRGDKVVERPFWNLINGPIEDCIWHVGQVVTFRRSSGNPVSEKVNYFTGTVN